MSVLKGSEAAYYVVKRSSAITVAAQLTDLSLIHILFDVKIVIARNSIPDIGKISGKIRVNDGIENALHILQYAADFSFEKDEETNVVTIR